MKPKRLLICVAALATCIALVLALLLTLDARTGVTKANYDRLQLGMKLAEVQQVFGSQGLVFHGYLNKTAHAHCWENRDGSHAILFFDDDGGLLEKGQWAVSTESMWDKILRLIHWPW